MGSPEETNIRSLSESQQENRDGVQTWIYPGVNWQFLFNFSFNQIRKYYFTEVEEKNPKHPINLQSKMAQETTNIQTWQLKSNQGERRR